MIAVLYLQFNEEAETAAAQAWKISQLDALEAAWRADQEARHKASSFSSWLSYGSSLITNIIQNVQVRGRQADTQTDTLP